MGYEVNTHHAQILHYGGGADDIGYRVKHHNPVAGVIVAGRCVVNLVRNVERDLRLTVVVRGRIEDGVRDFVAELEVGVLDGNTGGAGYAVFNGNLFNGIG